MKRFWSKVERKAETECWLWKGAVWGNGYGQFYTRSQPKYSLAHRVAYELTHGKIQIKTLQVMHICHQKLCCNPRHLALEFNSGHRLFDALTGGKRADNKSGITGVVWDKRGRWTAQAQLEGKHIHLYCGVDFLEACCARKSWEAQMLRSIAKTKISSAAQESNRNE